MTDRSGRTRDPSHHVEGGSSRSIVSTSRCKVWIVRSSTMECTEAPRPGDGSPDDAVALGQAEAEGASGKAGRVHRGQDDARPPTSVVALPAVVSLKERPDLVRERTNAAARPIPSFARRRGLPLGRLRKAIAAGPGRSRPPRSCVAWAARSTPRRCGVGSSRMPIPHSFR